MAIGIKRNQYGGGQITPFTWVGTTKTWDNGLVFTSGNTISEATPVLPSNCKLYATIDTYSPSAGASLYMNIKNKDASQWAQIYTKTYSTAGPHIETHEIDLSSFAGQEVMFQVMGGGSNWQIAISRFDITNQT